MDILKLTDCPPFLKDFLFYMETIKGRSARTVEAYYIDLRLFLRFIQNKYAPVETEIVRTDLESITIEQFDPALLEKITLSDAYEYLNYVLSKRANNSNTRARKVSSLRSFFKYLVTKTDYLSQNPVQELEVPTIKKSLPKYLSLEESQRLLNNYQSQEDKLELEVSSNPSDDSSVGNVVSAFQPQMDLRDYCMLTIFLNCGIRLSELVGINVQDLQLRDGKMSGNALRILGKGNKERMIYLNRACMEALDGYLEARREFASPKETRALFLSKRGTRITPRRVEQIVSEHLKAAGLDGKGYSVHKLRHTAATLLYQYGKVDIRALQEILGHANLSTTQIYTHVNDEQIRTAMEQSPLTSSVIFQKKK